MSLRPILSLLTALAILSIASVLGAGAAHAHGGHAHHASAAATTSTGDADMAMIEAELANIAPNPGDPNANEARQASNEQAPRPCDGHCCGVAGSSCCNLAPPAVGGATMRLPALACAAIPWQDGERDGLGPQALLRPPRHAA